MSSVLLGSLRSFFLSSVRVILVDYRALTRSSVRPREEKRVWPLSPSVSPRFLAALAAS